jgi:hypothetical protein
MIFWSCFRNITAINESESHLVKKQSEEEEKTDYFHQIAPIDWININIELTSSPSTLTRRNLALQCVTK